MAATSFTLLEALFIGFLYYLAYCEVSLPFMGAGLQDASTIGLLVGLYYGDVTQGLIIGASIGMLYIANGAVGGNLPSDGVLAACIAVPIALKNGLSIETAVALSVPFSLLGVFVDNGRRLVNGLWNRRAQEHVKEKQYNMLWVDGILGPTIVNMAFRILPLALVLFLFGGAAGDVVAQFPAWLNSGLGLIGAMLPGLGLMLCVIFMGKKELLPYFFIGYYIMYFTGISYVFVCVIGVLAALLHTQLIGWRFEADDDDDDDDDDEDEEEEEGSAITNKNVYGPGHAFQSRGQLIWWFIKYLAYFRMSQCIEYFYGTGIGLSMKKPLAKVYDENSDEYQTAMLRHLEPFITNPCWGMVLNTASIAMEEEIAENGDPDGSKGEAIETFKTSLMGPLAGLGDGIEVGIVMPLTKTLSYPLALQGNILGGWCMTIWFAWMLVPGIVSAVIGYETGRSGLMKLLESGQLKKILYGAGILGIMMMGAMSAGYCTVPLMISWETISGTTDLVSILNGLLPGILPLSYLMLSYNALNKGVKFTRLLIITCIFGLVMGLLGFC